MPRHPPCALHSLSHTPPTQPTPTNNKKTPPDPPKRATAKPRKSLTKMNQTWQCTQHTTKMLASTIQISNNNPTPEPHPPPRQTRSSRVHRAKTRTEAPDSSPTLTSQEEDHGLILQNPNSVPPPTRPAPKPASAGTRPAPTCTTTPEGAPDRE